MSTNHILIIALSNHPILGPLLIPYFAKTVSQGCYQCGGTGYPCGKRYGVV